MGLKMTDVVVMREVAGRGARWLCRNIKSNQLWGPAVSRKMCLFRLRGRGGNVSRKGQQGGKAGGWLRAR